MQLDNIQKQKGDGVFNADITEESTTKQSPTKDFEDSFGSDNVEGLDTYFNDMQSKTKTFSNQSAYNDSKENLSTTKTLGNQKDGNRNDNANQMLLGDVKINTSQLENSDSNVDLDKTSDSKKMAIPHHKSPTLSKSYTSPNKSQKSSGKKN